MDAGAFSDPKVVEAAKGLKLLLVDCTTVKGPQRELMNKYNVRGYPTVVFADSKGKKVTTLQGRSATSVAQQFTTHSKEYTLALPWAKSFEAAMSKAKSDSKPVALWVPDPKKEKKSKALEGMFFADEVKPLFQDFVVVKIPFDRKNAELKQVGVTSGAVLVILNPASEKPFKAVKRIRKAKNGAALAKDLTKALKAVKKAQNVSEKGS